MKLLKPETVPFTPSNVPGNQIILDSEQNHERFLRIPGAPYDSSQMKELSTLFLIPAIFGTSSRLSNQGRGHVDLRLPGKL